MSAASATFDSLLDLPRGSHVAWHVDDAARYESLCRLVLDRGEVTNEKVFAFGPQQATGQQGTITDPLTTFLGGRGLEPQTMFEMFRTQAALAKEEGFDGLRVVADMDWMLPARVTRDEAIAFELLLDQVVTELGATVVCAYRNRSFDQETISGVAAVHPLCVGTDVMFQMVADGADGWRLTGEVDFSVAHLLAPALTAALSAGPKIIDLSGLTFTDCAAMRVLAECIRPHGGQVLFRDVSAQLARLWELVGFHEVAPLTQAPPR